MGVFWNVMKINIKMETRNKQKNAHTYDGIEMWKEKQKYVGLYKNNNVTNLNFDFFTVKPSIIIISMRVSECLENIFYL